MCIRDRPQGGDGEFKPALLLAQAYRQALTAAVQEHCGSVAIVWPKFNLPGVSETDLLSILVQGEREFLAEQELWVTLVVEDVRRLRLPDSLINAVSRYIKDHYICLLYTSLCPCQLCPRSGRDAERRGNERLQR